MMRALLTALALLVAHNASANSYHECTAPLVLPLNATQAEPEMSFRLTLSDHTEARVFVAQGQRLDGARATLLLWKGSWISIENEVHLIGVVKEGDVVQEWRANAVFLADDVMILNLDTESGPPLMVRCLPAEGA